jgi:hypothetical protein
MPTPNGRIVVIRDFMTSMSIQELIEKYQLAFRAKVRWLYLRMQLFDTLWLTGGARQRLAAVDGQRGTAG